MRSCLPKCERKTKKKKQKFLEPQEDKTTAIDDEDDEPVTPVNSNTAAKSAFQMLLVDSDIQSSDSADSDVESAAKQNQDEPTQGVEKIKGSDQGAPAKGKTKAKGKDKKQAKKEEDDIDALLAEIEGKTDTKQDPFKGKKKKKSKAAVEKTETENITDKQPEEVTSPTEPSSLGDAAPEIGLGAKDISEMTQEEIAAWLDNDEYEEDDKRKKKKKKKEKNPKQQEATKEGEAEKSEEEGAVEEGITVKTAAQKKKEKRERQKQQKLLEKQQKNKPESVKPDVKKSEVAETNEANKETPTEHTAQEDKPKDEEAADDADQKKKKKRDKKKKKGEEEDEQKKKKPSKMAKAILEMQQKLKEEEERLRREEEEKELLLEEKRRQKEEQERKEQERREREKQKKKEKIERLKAEGKYLTAKQKEERRRAEQMLQALKAQGLQVPEKGLKKKVDYGPKKKKDQKRQKQEITTTEAPVVVEEIQPKAEEHQEKEKEKEEEIKESWEDEDNVKDSWDAESENEEDKVPETKIEEREKIQEQVDEKPSEETKEESEESEEESDEESEEESSEESSDEDVPPEKARDRALMRIQKRKDAAELKRSVTNLRAPVVCVLGHVDTGKTKILDKLRRTHVQDDEAGGITQQIGATNVPGDKIKEQTKMCKEFSKHELKIPGLLIIDTPGHESFSNLRMRGSSLCDIAILVIDIMHGLEPQTIESINLLKKRKTPFVVALNKIDRLFQWQSGPHADIANTLKKQKLNTKQEFDERTTSVVVQLAEQGLNACLFHENKNPREYISMVPTSAHTGDGMGNLIALICELSQTLLAKRIAFSDELQATVMEVKAIQGLGTTIDVILVNGSLSEGDTIVVAGQEGPIVTQIRALLMPQPMKELRVKNAYSKYKLIKAAQGCKIIAKDLEKALAGLPLYVAHKSDEIEIFKEEIAEALSEVLTSIKLQERGVFVQASTLGSLEALLEFLKTSKIPYAGINIGPVHKKDIMKASVMLEHDSQWAVILAFDVKVEREAQEMADSLGVRIFTAEIIYHLFDQFMAHREQLKKRKQEELKHVAVFPCKLRVLPQYIFNSRDPIVCGVVIEAGFLKEGMPLCVPSKEFCDLGRVSSLEINHKPVEKATKGQEVCIKIEAIPGETPKLYGRHFDHTDLLYTKISRQSIDAVKNYFREEMSKADWQLIIEMKKLFDII